MEFMELMKAGALGVNPDEYQHMKGVDQVRRTDPGAQRLYCELSKNVLKAADMRQSFEHCLLDKVLASEPWDAVTAEKCANAFLEATGVLHMEKTATSRPLEWAAKTFGLSAGGIKTLLLASLGLGAGAGIGGWHMKRVTSDEKDVENAAREEQLQAMRDYAHMIQLKMRAAGLEAA